METTLFYDSPRSINIGDIFYLIDTRESAQFKSPCRVCHDEGKLTVNGVEFACPVCSGYSYNYTSRERETLISVHNYTVATVKVFRVKQCMSNDTWKGSKTHGLEFSVYRKRGFGYNGDRNNFTRDYHSQDIKIRLNKMPVQSEVTRYLDEKIFIFDNYKQACAAAEILNNAETERLNKYNSEHGTSFRTQWEHKNDPKN